MSNQVQKASGNIFINVVVVVLGMLISYIGVAMFITELPLPEVFDNNQVATLIVTSLMFITVVIAKGITTPHLFVTAGIFGTFYGIALGLANFEQEMPKLISGIAGAVTTSLLGMLIAFIIENISQEEREVLQATDESKAVVAEIINALNSFKSNTESLTKTLEQLTAATTSIHTLESHFEQMPKQIDLSLEKWKDSVERLFTEHLELLAESAKKASSIHFSTYKSALDEWATTFMNAKVAISDYSQFISQLKEEQKENNTNATAIRELLTHLNNKG